MKKNLTEIVFILDRSGSMSGLEADTIGGFNSMIAKQKKQDGEALVSTVLFDNVSEVIHDRVNIRDIQPMTGRDYTVRGCTALLDAIVLLMAVAVTVTTAVHAQYVTYNHDSPKQNQVTVMETGTGALSPDLYYSVLHNKYKKSAAAKNKLSFRTLAGINLYNQVDEAEAIDSALVKRAKVEALNVADRQADIAWLAEGDKVSRQMDRFRRNIDRILLSGGTPADKERRTEYYHVYQCAINATKDAYMPNAQRKKEYLRI